MVKYECKQGVPSLDEYKYLCEAVGWKDFMNFEVAEKSLKNSVFGVTVYDHGQIIGMDRIVGDGAIYFYIQDVVIHPDVQGKGIGNEIMNILLAYLQEHAPEKAFIGLFASQGKESFYEKFDFKNYAPNMTGMFRVM
ncbi:GNAT family N-acetyltransferase [Jeotgalibacillus sp. R-1-5s-1]|uniref:GNAT family N-acetyltransferase n=1 Tax=Jeotgalibacillus sp. R-1-5s-1 TaxID=2555897 RepID=UPI0010693925|nr:GNAT family N-acetyltransferase [Jeotgalibacillus sp. R-1-5s-1]TFD94377.1 N-acetyltransferase [Jeotgalibacillus sp. R-1-5s-1]